MIEYRTYAETIGDVKEVGSREGQHRKDSKALVDTGCDIYSKCIECPFPACKYDDVKMYRAVCYLSGIPYNIDA